MNVPFLSVLLLLSTEAVVTASERPNPVTLSVVVSVRCFSEASIQDNWARPGRTDPDRAPTGLHHHQHNKQASERA